MAEQTPFLWGQGGTRMTPEDIAAQRKIAQSLMSQGMDYSPIQSPWQGAARMAQALLGGYQSGEADRASNVNGLESTSLRNDALGGGMPMAASGPAPLVASPVGAPMAVPTGGNAAAIRAGLIERGLPEHVADGFLMNFKDESSLNPGLNEAAPIVPGSRGGFGLAQWTGPRRVGLEQFAATKGLPVSDINLQLDYLSNELKGPEAAAAQKIMATRSPGDAAAMIARSFLRPAQEHLDRRVAQYTGGGDGAALPPVATEAQGYAIPGQPAAAPRAAINPAILKLISSPYAREGDKQIGMMLYKNGLEQQQKDSDPLRQLQIREAQSKLTPLGAPTKDADGNLIQTDALGKTSMLRPAESRPTSVAEYEYYKSNLPQGQQPMPYDTWATAKARAGAMNVSNNVSTGTIPQGYEQFTDPETKAIRMRPIPGGPKDPTKSDNAKADSRSISTDVVTNAASLARAAMDSATLPTTGTAGKMLAGVGETGAAELNRQVNVLTANAKVENLNAMRAASPTGGALGAVSDSENAMMAAKSGALDPGAPKAQFQRALEDYERTLLRVVHGKEQGDAIFAQTRKSGPQAPPVQNGMTATNPQTGEKIMLRDGKWVPFS